MGAKTYGWFSIALNQTSIHTGNVFKYQYINNSLNGITFKRIYAHSQGIDQTVCGKSYKHVYIFRCIILSEWLTNQHSSMMLLNAMSSSYLIHQEVCTAGFLLSKSISRSTCKSLHLEVSNKMLFLMDIMGSSLFTWVANYTHQKKFHIMRWLAHFSVPLCDYNARFPPFFLNLEKVLVLLA